MSRFTRAALGAVLLAAALPGVASAAIADVEKFGKTGVPMLTYQGEPGEVNNVRVSFNGLHVVIDDQVPIRAFDGCVIDANGNAVCTPGTFDARYDLGDKNDVIQYTAPQSARLQGEDGNDLLFAGLQLPRAGQAIEGVSILGSEGTDTVSYRLANDAVSVTLDGQFGDGRAVDRDNVGTDVENVEGSPFADEITGTSLDRRERYTGGRGDDVVNGLGGSDVFHEDGAINGADTYNGGSGIDLVDYSLRSKPVNVSLDLARNDGEPGEGDFVDPNVNDVFGGSAGDTITGSAGANAIRGNGGVDTLLGGDGPDVIQAADNTADVIQCGIGADTLERDLRDVDATGCETVNSVGRLALAAKARAGQVIQMKLSWTHPESWRKLREITLTLRDGRKLVGAVAIAPRAERISDAGAVKLAKSRLTHKDGKVTARLSIKLKRELAGRRLEADVVAADVRGNRQIERHAATLRVR